MKKVVLVQVVLLLCTVLLGISLKVGILPISTDIHKFFGIASGLAGLIVLILAFMQKQRIQIKLLAAAVILLTFSAGMGGSSLENTANYDLSYGQMVVSGFLALVISIVIYFKLPSKISRN